MPAERGPSGTGHDTACTCRVTGVLGHERRCPMFGADPRVTEAAPARDDGSETCCERFRYAGVHPNGHSRLCECGLKYDEHRPEAQVAESSASRASVAVPGPASASPAEPTGVELIAAERHRQTAVEGWTPEHDDYHDQGELARAAACYAIPNDDAEEPVLFPTRSLIDGSTIPPLWPWGRSWYKRTPYDRKRELVKAGALIAAEIDRLQRNPDAR